MKIAISTESTADLTKELIEQNDLKIIAYPILLGDESGFDGEISVNEIIDFVNKNKILPKTSAVNDYRFSEYFENLLKEYDAVIHFSLSKELSATYNNAVRASEKMKNVFVVDSRSLSTGIGLLALYAKKLVDKGLTAKEVYNACLTRAPYVQASFALKRLDYLYKGGRCNALTLFGANLLKIRPQIVVEDGKMLPGKKYRGNYLHVVKNYCQDVLEKFNTPDLSVAFVTYTTADQEIVNTAKQYLIDRGFEKVYVTRAGGTITSHCGEDCLGILYINDGGEK